MTSTLPASVLTAALDKIEYGVVLFDPDLQARYISSAYYRIWALPPPPPSRSYSFADLVEHARVTGAYAPGIRGSDDFARGRLAIVAQGGHAPIQLKLSDGRFLKVECIALPNGGRMLTYADITPFVQAADRLRILATTDDLTKLLNRRHFMDMLDKQFERARTHERPLSVMVFDADHFKRINDDYGHDVGDESLRALTARYRSLVNDADILGRIGGEEFGGIIAEAGLDEAVETAERLRRGVASQPFAVGRRELSLTVSVGLASRRAEESSASELLRLADRALYAAKADGRNRVASDVGHA